MSHNYTKNNQDEAEETETPAAAREDSHFSGFLLLCFKEIKQDQWV